MAISARDTDVVRDFVCRYVGNVIDANRLAWLQERIAQGQSPFAPEEIRCLGWELHRSGGCDMDDFTTANSLIEGALEECLRRREHSGGEKRAFNAELLLSLADPSQLATICAPTCGRTIVAHGIWYASGTATVLAFGDARIIATGHAVVEADNHVTVVASEYATVDARGSATVDASGHATVNAWGATKVWATDHACVDVSGYAAVWAYGAGSVCAHDHANVDASDTTTVDAEGRAEVIASGRARLWVSGSVWYELHDSAEVEICESRREDA